MPPLFYTNVRSVQAFKEEQHIDKLFFYYVNNENGEHIFYPGSATPMLFAGDDNQKNRCLCPEVIAREIQENKSVPPMIAIGDIANSSFAEHAVIHIDVFPLYRRFAVVYPAGKDKMVRFIEEFNNGEKLMGLAKRDGQILIQPNYMDILSYNWKVGLAPAKFKSRKWGYINYLGKTMIPPIYDEASEFDDDGHAKVTSYDSSAWDPHYLIDRAGKRFIPDDTDYYDLLCEAFEIDPEDIDGCGIEIDF